jgi:hypothetical protein
MYTLNDEGKKKLKGNFKPQAIADGVIFENCVPIIEKYPEYFDLVPSQHTFGEDDNPDEVKSIIKRINNEN